MKASDLRSVPYYKVVCQWLMLLFWLNSTAFFFTATPIAAAYAPVVQLVQLFTDACMIGLCCMTLRSKVDWSIILSFVIIAAISSIFFNDMSVIMMLNGIRLYLPLLTLVPIYRYMFATRERSDYFLERFEKSIYWFLWLQWPCMLFELIVMGGHDYGGGSLGDKMSGIISALIYILSFYLMKRRWNDEVGYISNLRKNWVLLFLLIPTMLNETKVSFIFMVLYFLLLIPIDRKFLKTMLFIGPLLAAALGAGVYVYSQINANNGESLQSDYLEVYVFGDERIYDMVEEFYTRGYGDETEDHDFARGVKLAMLPVLMKDKPHGIWIGYGTSQFKGGTTLDATPFYRTYEWLLLGTQIQAMTNLIDLGIIGWLWYIFALMVIFGLGTIHKICNRNILIFNAAMIILLTFYNTACFIPSFMIPFVGVTVCAWHWRIVTERKGDVGNGEDLNHENTYRQ